MQEVEKDRAGRVRELEEAAWAPQGLALSRDWLAANMSLIPPRLSEEQRGSAPLVLCRDSLSLSLYCG